MKVRSLILLVTIYVILIFTFATTSTCNEGEIVSAENTIVETKEELLVSSDEYETVITEYIISVEESSEESEVTSEESESESVTSEIETEAATIEESSEVATYTDYEIEMLAKCVMAEAGNQDLMGKQMVVDVILNRVRDDDWPDDIVSVITQKYQFSSYWNGMDTVTPTEECYIAIQLELEEISYPGLYYFTAGHYGDYGTPWGVHGDHYFCTK